MNDPVPLPTNFYYAPDGVISSEEIYEEFFKNYVNGVYYEAYEKLLKKNALSRIEQLIDAPIPIIYVGDRNDC